MNQFQQGDVLFQEISKLPKGLKRIEKEGGEYIITRGEITGHAHTIQDEIQLFKNDKEEMFLKTDKTVALHHQEHKTLSLIPAIYKIAIVREYDYFKEATVYVPNMGNRLVDRVSE